MKQKIIYYFLQLFLLLSISTTMFASPAVIKCNVGSDISTIYILKHDKGEVHLYKKQEVLNGTATVQIDLEDEGYYFVSLTRLIHYPIYIHPGDELSLSVNMHEMQVYNDENGINTYLATYYAECLSLLRRIYTPNLDHESLKKEIENFEIKQLEEVKRFESSERFYQAQSIYIKATATEYLMRPLVMANPTKIMKERETLRDFWKKEFDKIDIKDYNLHTIPNGLIMAGFYMKFADFILGQDRGMDYLLSNLENEDDKVGIVKMGMRNFKTYDAKAEEFIGKYKNYFSNDDMAQINAWKVKFENALPGKTVPRLTMETREGKNINLSSFNGKWTYIDLWATWCGPCKHESPNLIKLADEMKGYNIAFVAVSLDTDRILWQNYLQKKESGQVIHCYGGGFQSPIAEFFNVTSVPRFILIDPNGKIVNNDMTRPSDPATKAALIKLLES